MTEIRYSCRSDDEYMVETNPGDAIYQYLWDLPDDSLPETVTLRKFESIDSDTDTDDGSFPMREVSSEVVHVREWCSVEAPELLEESHD